MMKFRRELRRTASVVRYIPDAGLWVAFASVILIMMIVVVDVAVRKLVGSSILIAEEVGGYLLVAITFLSLGYALREEAHIRCSVLVERLSQRVKDILYIGYSLLALVFLLVLMREAWRLAWDSLHLKAISTYSVVGIPSYLPQLLIPIGIGILLIELAIQGLHRVRRLMRESMPGAKKK